MLKKFCKSTPAWLIAFIFGVCAVAYAADYDGNKKANELDAPAGTLTSASSVFVADPSDTDKVTVTTSQAIITSVLSTAYDTPEELAALFAAKLTSTGNYLVSTDCSGITGGCCYDSDDYIMYCWDGSSPVEVGKKSYNSPDNITGDGNADGLLDQAVLADLTYGLASSPGSPVSGKIYPVNGLDVDPANKKITSGPDTVYAFVDSNPDTITDTGSGFVTDGFLAGMRIKVTGSASNNGYFTIATVAAGTLTLIATDSLTAEAAGETVTILGNNHYFIVRGPDGNYYSLFSEMGEWFVDSIASGVVMPDSFCVAMSDESTALTTGTAKRTFRMPYAMTLDSDGVRASVVTAPTGATIIIDINEGGTTIMDTTKLSIDASEKTSTTAASAAVLSDTTLADDAEMTLDIDQIGSGTAGAGAKVCFRGLRSW